MANTYKFSLPDNSIAQRSDGAFVPWNPQVNQPADIGGSAGRIWKDDGSPIPDPFVPTAPTPDETRTEEYLNDQERIQLVDQFRNASPAQIRNFINTNVTDLASARAMLIKIALLVALHTRN